MILTDFKDKHKGEEMIVICNGKGLKNIPFAFLESRPNFCINFFSHWTPWLKVDYWAGTDDRVYEMIGDPTLKGIPKFLPRFVLAETRKPHPEEGLEDWAKEEIIYYQFKDQLKGFVNVTRGPNPDSHGLRYGTTAVACAHLCHYMGASTVLLVGFDCTLGLLEYEGKGLSKLSHYYDKRDHQTELAVSWNRQMGFFADWARERGTEVINLSAPTMCDTVPQDRYENWWTP